MRFRLVTLPLDLLRDFQRHRNLIGGLVKREFEARYRGSMLGLAWPLLQPLLLLAVYSFVFSRIFSLRWSPSDQGGQATFSLYLFAGLIVFNIFAEILGRSPRLIVDNANLVKRVVFPLHVLPLVALAGAVINAALSGLVLLVFQLVLFGLPPLTALAVPLLMLPFLLACLGLAWFLASLGTFLRDIAQVVGLVVTAGLFLSPVFYPLSRVPEPYQAWLTLSPLTMTIEWVRLALFQGQLPGAAAFAGQTALGLVVCGLGYAWFAKTRHLFADVL